eukprot:CAMPEP_0113699622 /NCGR_PEP_ID=MMETSP0038_2-20120614/23439_1 /TAXON_ID=2898 /ORGANISM="Cryptomonas paramecium" /LENGTH=127 /DNA_ID=CAMNT_0000623059 /DNA_START=82 /DNA_END=461 /DNA_ORIENTATION=- /assembly_acc=CAM_ASM_000170
MQLRNCLVLIAALLLHSCESNVLKAPLALRQPHSPMRLRGGNKSYLAAYLLLRLGGKESPTPEEVTDLLEKAGAKTDEDIIKFVCEKMNGREVDDLIEDGKKMLIEENKFNDQVAALAAGAGGGGGG